MISVPEAIARLLAAVEPLPAVAVPWDRARGRTLVDDVRADRDAPSADRSAMDGYAVRSEDLRVPGATLRAGEGGEGTHVTRGTCVRITTGAVVPQGADAVVMVERAVEEPGTSTVRFDATAAVGANVRRRGEDVRAGDVVVAAGSTLRAAEIAALAAVGGTSARVVSAPRIAVLSTGDEVVEIDRRPAPWQVRNSNAAMLLALLEERGLAGSYLGIAGDERGTLDALLDEGLRHDVLVVTGGVSVGKYDLVGDALARRGATILFHKVAMRPGKPILAARCGTTLVLGLPGNPVSAFTAFHVFVAPALRKLSGEVPPVPPSLRVKLAAKVARRPGRRTYALGRLDPSRIEVAPVAVASSGDLFALARANAFIVVEEGDLPLDPGQEVEVLAWE